MTQMGRPGEEQREEDTSVEALQLVKNEERVEHEQVAEAAEQATRQPSPHAQSVITRRAVRTITAAGHITETTDVIDDSVKDEPPEAAQMEQDQLQHYAPKLEENPDVVRDAQQQYEEERMRLAEAESEARHHAFKQETYRSLPSPIDKRLQPQYTRAPPRPDYRRPLTFRYGAPPHVVIGQEGEAEEHSHEAYLAHKDKAEQLQVYATSDSLASGDGRQYAAVLGEQATTSNALEMIQTTSLSNQQAVGVTYQPVKYETRSESEPRPTTYASLQPVTSVHGGYSYAGQSPQYGSAGYSAYAGGGKELLTLYGGGSSVATAPRGDESPPSQLMYRSDPTLSSSSLPTRGTHVVYGSVPVPPTQAVYEAPPSPNSQQVRLYSYLFLKNNLVSPYY